jgi:hypothetical protein
MAHGLAIVKSGKRNIGTRPRFYGINRESPQARGLVGWWPLGEGRPIEQMANAPTTIVGTKVTGRPVLGAARDFSAATDKITTPDRNAWDCSAFTVSAWVSVRGTGGGTYGYIMARGSSGSVGGFALHVAGPPPIVRWRLNAGGVATQSIDWNTPVLLTGVAPGGTAVTLYKNGTDPKSATSSVYSASAYPIHIGNEAGDTRNFDGQISDVRFYNRALSAEEVWALYDPATRWDLYWQPTKTYFDLGTITDTAIAPAIWTSKNRPTGQRPRFYAINRDSPQAQKLHALLVPQNGVFQEVVHNLPRSYYTQQRALVSGQLGQAARLGGSPGWSQYPIPTIASSATQPWTVAAWVTTLSDYTFRNHVEMAGSNYISLRHDNAATNYSRYGSGTGVTGTISVPHFVPHLMTGTTSNNTHRLYVNGVFDGQQVGLSTSNVSTIQLSDDSYGPDAICHEVRLYLGILSDREIYALWDPATRWDLYWQPGRRLYHDLGAAAGVPTHMSYYLRQMANR